MAIPAHNRVAFLGTLTQATGGGSEIFEFGFADASSLTPQALSAALLPVMQTAWTDASNSFSSFAILTGCRVEAIALGGAVTASYLTTGTHPAGANTGAPCTILSQAVTLETNTANNHGRTVQGRFYPPGYAPLSGATVLASSTTALAQAWRGIMAGLVTAGARPVVASTTGGGQLAPVTAVSMDNVIDTQRRRKNHVTVVRSAKIAL